MNKNYTPINHRFNGFKSYNKPNPLESETISSEKQAITIEEAVEYKIPKEVKPYIKQRPEIVEVLPEIKNQGVVSNPHTTAVTFQSIKLPLSDDKILLASRAPITSSIRWLATLAIYILKQAHLVVKKVGGRAVRLVAK